MKCLMTGILDIGGVGKTTYIYRLVGVPVRLKTTLRPAIYKTAVGGTSVCILDVPGHHAAEVAEALAKSWPYYLDLVIYMYDVTDAYTLQNILDRPERHSKLFYIKQDQTT